MGLASGSVPPVIYQMTMEPMMEADPGTKQALLNKLSWVGFMRMAVFKLV